MPKRVSGFTLVELLIIIVVIAILAAISVVAYIGIQSRARDAERVSDFNAMRRAIEMYYADHGSYPFQSDMVGNSATRAAWAKENLGVTDAVLLNPMATSGTHSSWSAAGSAVTSAGYSYYAIAGDGSLCAAAGQCTGGYRMGWRNEAGVLMPVNKNL